MMDKLTKFKQELVKHIEYNNRRFGRRLLGLLGVSAITGIIFYDQIRDYITEQSSHVAKGTLDDPEFRKRTVQFSNSTITELCHDPVVVEQLSELVNKYLKT